MTITSKADLNRVVAGIICPEPPASERRAIHESGAWYWVLKKICLCDECSLVDHDAVTTHDIEAHWEPAAFCTDPAASDSLEGWESKHSLLSYEQCLEGWKASVFCKDSVRWVYKMFAPSRHMALALAVCAAHGVELEFADGWDTK